MRGYWQMMTSVREEAGVREGKGDTQQIQVSNPQKRLSRFIEVELHVRRRETFHQRHSRAVLHRPVAHGFHLPAFFFPLRSFSFFFLLAYISSVWHTCIIHAYSRLTHFSSAYIYKRRVPSSRFCKQSHER